MKTISKRILCAVAAATMITAGVASVSAAEFSTGETQVIYENKNIVPENPEEIPACSWAVVIPSNIAIHDQGEVVDTTVSLIGMNGTDIDSLSAELQVNVTVASDHNFSLANQNDDQDKVGYTLTYNQKSNEEIGNIALTKKHTTQAGTLQLNESSTKPQPTTYTDTLTYTVIPTTQKG